MKDLYSRYTGDDLWLIKETGWQRPLQNIREAQFAQGNGYLGVRGVLEEIPYDAMPGTYISGVYDKVAAQVSKLVNLPNAFNFKFTVGGEKLDVIAMDVLMHKRALNMRKGLLLRHTIYRDVTRKRYDYQSLRFVSMHDKNIGVMQIAVTPMDGDCELDINTGIDTGVYNAGVLSEGRKKHFRLREVDQTKNAGYLAVETLERRHAIICWSGFYYQINGGKKIFARNNIFTLPLKKNQTILFTKIFYVRHFPADTKLAKYKAKSYNKFSKVFNADFEDVIKAHKDCWKKLWHKADILIEGTANLQQNVRFNIYHMLICGSKDEGFSSIGARTLSGEGYRGHIFWDAEIFVMPFYLFVFPEIARNMLLYRYKRLNAARNIARKNGYKGAQFAWESADTGEDETPEWARDIDGTIVKIHTNRMEHHITADIAYAVYKYYLITGDEKFMRDYGYEMMFETARFWASRAEYHEKKRRFDINHVIGPDEFHIDVNNNAYTNIMAKWNLITAYKLFCALKKDSLPVCQNLAKKINLRDKEAVRWKKTASLMAVNINKNKVIEQFDGYFNLKKIPIAKTDENGMPLLPARMRARDLGKTQFVKQADVIMLLCLLSDVFNLKTKQANYHFYMSKTLHKSSLSASIYSLIASECYDLSSAYSFFNVALRTDISNLYTNTKEGMHAACLGGTWQAIIFGFAGINIDRGILGIIPRMPRTWSKLVFSLSWRRGLIKLELTNENIKIKINSSKIKSLKINVFGKKTIIKTNKTYSFRKKTVLSSITDEYY